MRRIQNYFTLNRRILVFRKKLSAFNSIENVFDTLLPLLKLQKVELPYPSRGLIFRIKNILFLSKKANSLIHVTGYDHYLLWRPFRNSILTIHDLEALKRKSGIKYWFFKKLWFDIPISNATIVTTISEFSKNEINSIGNYKTPIVVIPNPLCLPLILKEKQFNTKNVRVLQLGVKENKNIFRLIKALEGLNCTLVIVGSPSDSLVKELDRSRLVFEIKMNLSNEEVILEYYKCDIVTLVSTYEGFGLPIIEAQAVGRPVITSNVASMPEVAGDGALLVDPYNITAIREGIVRLINDDNLREGLIDNGLDNVKRFQPDRIASQYLELYQTLDK